MGTSQWGGEGLAEVVRAYQNRPPESVRREARIEAGRRRSGLGEAVRVGLFLFCRW